MGWKADPREGGGGPRFGEDHADVPIAAELRSTGDKPDGNAGETSP